MITKNSLVVQKSARYFTLGGLNLKTKQIWIVLHGYGQLGHEFIKEFKSLNTNECFIVAPEGLNRFYFRGFNGKIGASWMTKEDREYDIKDYVNFLNQIYNEISREIALESVKINILGFSQGCHTAVRWLERTKHNIDNLVLFGGSFPVDVDFKKSKEYWQSINVRLFIGDKDRMVDTAKVKNQVNDFSKFDFNPTLEYFSGGHEIKQDILLKKI